MPLDKNAPFGPQGLAATASLHFDRKEIDKIKLDGKEDLLKSPKNKRGMMLMVQLESPFPHQLDEDEQELFQGYYFCRNRLSFKARRKEVKSGVL
ncbi:MAG: hypothetical protein IPL28_05710 [Chloroflexi bacterium]|nr:hypothetical protein [Chloroflexota bacterium]